MTQCSLIKRLSRISQLNFRGQAPQLFTRRAELTSRSNPSAIVILDVVLCVFGAAPDRDLMVARAHSFLPSFPGDGLMVERLPPKFQREGVKLRRTPLV